MLIPAALFAGVSLNVLSAWVVDVPAATFELQSREVLSDSDLANPVAEYISDPRYIRNVAQGEPTSATLAVYRRFTCTKKVFRRSVEGSASGMLSRRHTDIQFGLPFRSLQYSVRDEDEDILSYPTGPWRVEGLRGGWPLDRTPTWPAARIYPLTILPFGFIANALLYAGMVYLLTLVPNHLRRAVRRRRGLCTTCNYDRSGLASDAHCPECNTPAPAR